MNPRPPSHAARVALHNEIHARPPDALAGPLLVSHVVMWCDAVSREASRAHVAAWLAEHHLATPDPSINHVRADMGGWRLRWELHTEFVSWTFIRSALGATPSSAWPGSALDAVAQDRAAALPGQCVTAVHLWVLNDAAQTGLPAVVREALDETQLVASVVGHGSAQVYTDFRLHTDGFSRMLLLGAGLTPRAQGRVVQQLLEIETYRMAALMGLPLARDASGSLAAAEASLAELAQAIRQAQPDQEAELLDQLTRLAGQVESQHAATQARFSASAAYFELVDQRIGDLAEERLPGLPTIGEFMDRRLSPARATCASAARRHEALSRRVSRISQLLRTRVEFAQQSSSRELLAAMNQRQALQLRLQATVEGLSVAAITYYIVGLVGYLAKAAQGLGWPLSAEVTAGASIPAVALAVWWSLRRVHARLGSHV